MRPVVKPQPPASTAQAHAAGHATTALTSLPRGDVEDILGLIADEVRILLPSWSDEDRGTGGDIDCAVQGVDPLWPLRLDPHTTLLQCLEYDIGARFWILERNGSVFAIDAIDDQHGIGRYAFPTAPLFEERGLVPTAGARAAYRSVKRLRKGIRDSEDWRATATLAHEDATGFVQCLSRLLGPEIAEEFGERVLSGGVPSEDLARDVRVAVASRRVASPWYVLALATRLGRVLRRVRWPTGLVIAVVGPDGSGKSTLARSLPDACRGMFRREALFHWRPGVLPRPGTLFHSSVGDPSRPHEREPHSTAVSAALLLYYWADFFIGSWTRLFALRVRTGLVILERGWWDILVDPRRYRLDVPPRLVEILGKLLPKPDLTLACEAPVEMLLNRKDELGSGELSRQMAAWRSLRADLHGVHLLDASASADDVRKASRTVITDHLERRAIARLGHGWTRLPGQSGNRWSLPRGPVRMAAASLLIYQPMTPSRRAAWELARIAAGSGGLRFLPRMDAAPRTVRERIAPFVPRRGSFVAARANHPGRYVAMILDGHGQPHLVAKVATDDPGIDALHREASQIDQLGQLLASPLRPPTVVDDREGLLALRAERWGPRWRPWHLDQELAGALGTFFARLRTDGPGGVPVGPAHGDFAPWNILKTNDGWLLIDWEYAASDRPAFYDVFHYLVQSHVLLGRPSRQALLGATIGEGPLASTLSVYARAADVDLGLAPDLLGLYAKLSAAHLDPGRPDGRRGLAVRNELSRWVDSRR
jgi:thymidylate kinase